MTDLFSRFEWDERTLSYRRVRWSFQRTLQVIPRIFFWGLLVGGGSVPLTYSFWERYFVSQIEKKTSQLQAYQAQLLLQVRRWEARRQQLYERVQRFYRPLLGLPPLSTSEWEGGMGGAPATALESSLYQSQRLYMEYQSLERQFKEVNARLTRIPCILPAVGPISSGFGFRTDPFTGEWQMHHGIDIDAPFGAPVRAAAAGKVISAGWEGSGYGIQVEIDHLNGIVTKYAHLSRTTAQVGEMVLRGQVIGYVGSTGRSTAPHLHYEVIERGVKVNPQKYVLLP